MGVTPGERPTAPSARLSGGILSAQWPVCNWWDSPRRARRPQCPVKAPEPAIIRDCTVCPSARSEKLCPAPVACAIRRILRCRARSM